MKFTINHDTSSYQLLNTPIKLEFLNNDEVLVLYKAEDTYVSPNWYPTKNKTHKVVPTWNYQSVYFYGRIFPT